MGIVGKQCSKHLVTLPHGEGGHSKLEGQLNVGGTFKSCISLNFIFIAYLLHPNYICMLSKICCCVRALDCVKGKGGDLPRVTDMLCILIGVLVM